MEDTSVSAVHISAKHRDDFRGNCSRLLYFVSVVGEIGSRLVCPCCRRHNLTGTEAISDS
jgi:hypothetical protein